ncbi:unnamed protein product, partial [marine sediment metagenome]
MIGTEFTCTVTFKRMDKFNASWNGFLKYILINDEFKSV